MILLGFINRVLVSFDCSNEGDMITLLSEGNLI